MARRKTMDIKAMVENINYRNRESTCSAEVRDGWNSLLEWILSETGNYNGYGYYLPSEVPEGHLPGVQVLADGGKLFPDESRRYYYLKAGVVRCAQM